MTLSDFEKSGIPPTEVLFNQEKGTKIVIQYYEDEEGVLVKETREFRIEKRLVPSQVAERKKWAKFGAAKNEPPGGYAANTYPADVVTMQHIHTRQPDQEQERNEDEMLKSKTRIQTAMCRYCKGNHFSHKCSNKSDMEAMQALREKLKGKTEASDEPKEPEQPVLTGGRYLPPPLRAAAGTTTGTGATAGSDKRSFDGFTVRVTNLPSDTTADDLKQLFTPFGHVTRIYPAKDKATQQNRGFAFISYSSQGEAAAAIYSVNGLRHNHVVLKVDWAKPSAN